MYLLKYCAEHITGKCKLYESAAFVIGQWKFYALFLTLFHTGYFGTMLLGLAPKSQCSPCSRAGPASPGLRLVLAHFRMSKCGHSLGLGAKIFLSPGLRGSVKMPNKISSAKVKRDRCIFEKQAIIQRLKHFLYWRYDVVVHNKSLKQ